MGVNFSKASLPKNLLKVYDEARILLTSKHKPLNMKAGLYYRGT